LVKTGREKAALKNGYCRRRSLGHIARLFNYRYVGDLLGFSNIILNLTHDEYKNRVEEWIQLCKDGVREFRLEKHYQLISDTIFVGAEDSRDALEKLLDFSKHMLNLGIKRSLPMRGAISFGEVTWDKEITFGKAIVNAYNLENDQDWIGTCCEHDLPRIDELWDFHRVFVYPAPMKSEKKLMFRPVISWNVPEYRELRDKTAKKEGLAIGDMDWKYAYRIQHTMMFSLYLKGVLNKTIQARPSKFPPDIPIEHIDSCVNEFIQA
jgi:hypothetical protein